MSGKVTTPLGEHTHTLDTADVLRVRDELVARGRTGRDIYLGTRVEVHALLQLALPMPPEDAVTDAHRIAADRARKLDPNHTDAHHWLQKSHATALWNETDRLLAAAGVK